MTEPKTQENENIEETEALTPEQPEVEDPAHAAQARINELEKQVSEFKDGALREMADAENTRRRAQKDREETSKYAIAKFAKEILTISDNFSRALEAAPKDHADPSVKNLVVGIDATERQLQAVLERFGIKKVDPIGQLFDPNFHRVMMEVEVADKQPGTVVQVLQAGYTIHDRLLREALVSVAKGPSEAPPKVDESV